MENPTKQSFVTIIKIMQLFRWYPPEKKSKRHVVEGYVLYIFLLVVVDFLATVKMFIEKEYDFMQVIYISETIWYALKLLPFLNGNDRIKKCIGYFDGVEFQPQDNTEKEILSNSVSLCQIMSNFYIVGITCVEIVYVLSPLFSNRQELPLQIWLPYSTTSSILTYYVTYFYVCFSKTVLL